MDDKDRKPVVKALRAIYISKTQEQARSSLQVFEVEWGQKYGYIVKQWEQNWGELMAFLDFPLEIRKIIYTTNAGRISSSNYEKTH